MGLIVNRFLIKLNENQINQDMKGYIISKPRYSLHQPLLKNNFRNQPGLLTASLCRYKGKTSETNDSSESRVLAIYYYKSSGGTT